MKLYHGTSEAVGKLALTEGLKTRGALGIKSNWNVESHPDYVYLTIAYAAYFAATASMDEEDGFIGRLAIVEVDTSLLDDDTLHPDEDALEQGTRGESWVVEACEAEGFNPRSMEERTHWFRNNLYSFQHFWKNSLEALGNCCHEGDIPPEAVTRVVFFDPKSNPSILSMSMDPMISVLNYQIMGPQYEALVRWFFDPEVKAEQIDPLMTGFLKQLEPGMPMYDVAVQRQAALDEVLALRDGLEVLVK